METIYYGRPIPKYPCSAIVYKDGTKVIARDMDGKLIAKGNAGVDDAKVIQSAINSLTENRTWKEKVTIKGTFTINNTIKIPSYTILNCTEACLKLPSGSDFPIITNMNLGKYDEDIVIYGGIFDGNNNTYSSAGSLIYVVGGVDTPCQNIIIYGCKVTNINGDGDNGVGIWLKNVMSSKVIHCWAENCKTGISVEGTNNYGSIIAYCVTTKNNVGICPGLSHNMIVEGNVVMLNSGDGIAVDSAHEILLRNNYCSTNGGKGINLFSSINDVPEKATILGNYVINNSSGGIYVQPSPYCIIEGNYVVNNGNIGISVIGNSRSSQIIGNKVMNNGMDGIYLYDAHNSIIEANICLNNGQVGTGYSGINLKEYANGCVIIGNRCFDDQTSKTQSYGISISGSCTYVTVKNNTVRENKTQGIYITTTGIVYLLGNDGYKTENSGTASITGDGSTTTFTIPHGLVSTPNYVNVLPKAGAPTPDSIDADATNITLTFSTAPESGTYYYWWEARL